MILCPAKSCSQITAALLSIGSEDFGRSKVSLDIWPLFIPRKSSTRGSNVCLVPSPSLKPDWLGSKKLEKSQSCCGWLLSIFSDNFTQTVVWGKHRLPYQGEDNELGRMGPPRAQVRTRRLQFATDLHSSCCVEKDVCFLGQLLQPLWIRQSSGRQEQTLLSTGCTCSPNTGL